MIKATTGVPLSKAHTIRLTFNDTPEDQALYDALRLSSEREYRTPLPRQIRYLLKMAMGLLPPDQDLLHRIREARELHELRERRNAASVPPPPTRTATTLRLIPGGAGNVTSEGI